RRRRVWTAGPQNQLRRSRIHRDAASGESPGRVPNATDCASPTRQTWPPRGSRPARVLSPLRRSVVHHRWLLSRGWRVHSSLIGRHVSSRAWGTTPRGARTIRGTERHEANVELMTATEKAAKAILLVRACAGV